MITALSKVQEPHLKSQEPQVRVRNNPVVLFGAERLCMTTGTKDVIHHRRSSYLSHPNDGVEGVCEHQVRAIS